MENHFLVLTVLKLCPNMAGTRRFLVTSVCHGELPEKLHVIISGKLESKFQIRSSVSQSQSKT